MPLKVSMNKQFDLGMLKDEISATRGIRRIRRRPPTEPPLHYVSPIKFQSQSGKEPRNVLEQILWTKDTEVTQEIVSTKDTEYQLKNEGNEMHYVGPFGKDTEVTQIAEPKAWDWCDRGAVVPVKTQLGSTCWAYATTSSIESGYQIANGVSITMSEQHLIKCDKTYNKGFKIKGSVRKAFRFLMANNGDVYRDSDYPSTNMVDPCICRDLIPCARINGFERVPRNDEAALKTAVLRQPVTACIDCTPIIEYKKDQGIYRFQPGTPLDLNHNVVIVGFGTENGVDFWKVRNSWGTEWGENGYIRLERNVSDDHGTCGIAVRCFYPVFTDPEESNRV